MKYLSILSVLLLIGGNFSFAMEDGDSIITLEENDNYFNKNKDNIKNKFSKDRNNQINIKINEWLKKNEIEKNARTKEEKFYNEDVSQEEKFKLTLNKDNLKNVINTKCKRTEINNDSNNENKDNIENKFREDRNNQIKIKINEWLKKNEIEKNARTKEEKFHTKQEEQKNEGKFRNEDASPEDEIKLTGDKKISENIDNDSDYGKQLRFELENKYQLFLKKNIQYIGRLLFKRNRELSIDFLEHMKEQKLDKSYFNVYYYFEWLMKNYIIDHVRWLLKKKAEKDNVKYEDKSDDEIEKFFMENAALVQKLTNEFYEEFREELKKDKMEDNSGVD